MKRCLTVALLFLLAVSLISAYPRIPVGELFARSTCPPCRTAHTMLASRSSEWEDSTLLVVFHVSGDPFHIPAGDSRATYYRTWYPITGIPDMMINGADYRHITSDYIPTFRSFFWTSSFVGIEIVKMTFDSIGIDIWIEDSSQIGDYSLIALICQDSLFDASLQFDWVVKEVLTNPGAGDPLTLSYPDTIYRQFPLPVPPGADPENVYFGAYVAGPIRGTSTTAPTIQNAVKRYLTARPAYIYHTSINVGKRITDYGDTAIFVVTVYNDGTVTDNYHLKFEVLSEPASWTSGIGGTHSTWDLSLSSMSEQEFPVIITKPVRGVGRYRMIISADSVAGRVDTLSFTLGAKPKVLVVNDSPDPDSSDYCRYFNYGNHTYLYWNVKQDGALSDFTTYDPELVIWYTGNDTSSSVLNHERGEFTTHFIRNSRCFILSGAGICQANFGAFLSFTLSINYVAVKSSPLLVSATHDVTEFDGWSGTLSGAARGEVMTPISSTPVLQYFDGTIAGVVRDSPGKFVFMGFPMEALPYREFRLLMNRCLEFFDISGVEETGLPTSISISAYPNPFNTSCQITYAIPDGNNGTLEIIGVDGRVVLNKSINGSGIYTWNAYNVSSGIYHVQVRSGNTTQTARIALIK